MTKCFKCDIGLKHRDYVKRIVKSTGGIKFFVRVERKICPKCQSVRRDLPDYILPYKHYDKRIIQGVIAGTITPYVLGYEDYPCEMTMARWSHNLQSSI